MKTLSKNTFSLSIPEPCHENLDAMNDTTNGKYCGSCAKEVVDFSQWSSEDIQSYLKANPNTCGLFAMRQLKKTFKAKTYTRHSASTFQRLALGVLLFSSIGGSFVNQAQANGFQKNFSIIAQSLTENSILEKKIDPSGEVPFSISLIVKDADTDEMLSEVSCMLYKATDEGTFVEVAAKVSLKKISKTEWNVEISGCEIGAKHYLRIGAPHYMALYYRLQEKPKDNTPVTIELHEKLQMVKGKIKMD